MILFTKNMVFAYVSQGPEYILPTGGEDPDSEHI